VAAAAAASADGAGVPSARWRGSGGWTSAPRCHHLSAYGLLWGAGLWAAAAVLAAAAAVAAAVAAAAAAAAEAAAAANDDGDGARRAGGRWNYMGYGGPVGVSGWGGPAGTPVCCRRWERCFALRLDDSSTLLATTWAFDDHGLLRAPI